MNPGSRKGSLTYWSLAAMPERIISLGVEWSGVIRLKADSWYIEKEPQQQET